MLIQLCFDFYKKPVDVINQVKEKNVRVKKEVKHRLDQLSLDFTAVVKVVFNAASGRYFVGKESFTTKIKAQFYLMAIESGFSFG